MNMCSYVNFNIPSRFKYVNRKLNKIIFLILTGTENGIIKVRIAIMRN